jgi:hypothetical protein
MDIRDKPIAPGSPWQNGFAERLIGSIRRECVDHIVVLGEKHLRRVLKSYAGYYNEMRTHRSLDKDAPLSRPVQRTGSIMSHALLGGLHHHYVRVLVLGTHSGIGHVPIQAYFLRPNLLRVRSGCTHAYIANAPLLAWLASTPPMSPEAPMWHWIGQSIGAAMSSLPEMYAMFPMIAGRVGRELAVEQVSVRKRLISTRSSRFSANSKRSRERPPSAPFRNSGAEFARSCEL